jgi:hypothetical protein
MMAMAADHCILEVVDIGAAGLARKFGELSVKHPFLPPTVGVQNAVVL